MGVIDFKLPDLGEGVHEGQVMHLHVREGDLINEDEPLMEVETDKAAVEIPSPQTGRVTKVHVEEGQVVNVGNVMVTFGDADSPSLEGGGQDVGAAHERREQTGGPEEPQPTSTAVTEGGGRTRTATPATNGNAAPVHRRKPASPAVRKLARKLELDIETIKGSGPNGRITRADVEIAARTSAPSSAPAPTTTDATRVAETNLASRVPTQAHEATPPRPSLAASDLALPGESSSDQYGETSHLPISRARMTIAQTMNQSWSTIPHVTDCDDADVTELDTMRRGFNDANPDNKLSMLPFVVRAVASALRKFPIFNASFDAERGEIIYKRYINICIGVQTDRGLIAPPIRNADFYSVSQLNVMIADMIERVRSGSFEVNDLRGGTFTISNAGAMGGSRYATPLVTPGQVAVIAIGRSKKMPWVVNDEILPRLIMPLSLSFDHRIIDGAEEIAFQQAIIKSLENPVHLM